MQERRQHNERIDDLEGKMKQHILNADEKWESIETHIAEVRALMNKFDGVDNISLKAIVDIAKGADTISKLAINISKVIGAFLIILAGFIALVKYAMNSQ